MYKYCCLYFCAVTFGLQHSKCQVCEAYICAPQANNAGIRTTGQLDVRIRPTTQNRK